MSTMGKLFGTVILFGMALALIAAPKHTAPASQPSPRDMAGMNMPQSSDEPVPAYHAQPPKAQDALPATMSPDLFTDPIVQNAYSVAASIKKVLYQEPCYCHCDRSQGHGSLLDCFASRHGSGCNICMGEDFYAYEQSHQGKTAAQIREGIMRGDWQSVDLKKYQKPLSTK